MSFLDHRQRYWARARTGAAEARLYLDQRIEDVVEVFKGTVVKGVDALCALLKVDKHSLLDYGDVAGTYRKPPFRFP